MLLQIKMIDQIENELKQRLENEDEKQKIAIADINYALNNGWLLELLQ